MNVLSPDDEQVVHVWLLFPVCHFYWSLACISTESFFLFEDYLYIVQTSHFSLHMLQVYPPKLWFAFTHSEDCLDFHVVPSTRYFLYA